MTIADTPALTSVTLRRVSADDERFLRELYASTRERELSIVTWSGEQKTAFLAMQFEAQDSYYRTQYPDAQFDVIEIERVPAGRLYLFATVAELRVIDIALLPQFRNRGIGGGLMRTIFSYCIRNRTSGHDSRRSRQSGAPSVRTAAVRASGTARPLPLDEMGAFRESSVCLRAEGDSGHATPSIHRRMFRSVGRSERRAAAAMDHRKSGCSPKHDPRAIRRAHRIRFPPLR